MIAKPKVALVHDYLMDFGGAEQVLLALSEIYPEAPIYTAIYDRNGLGEFAAKFKELNIRTSWFNQLPGARSLISPLRFLLPLIWGSINLSEYDLIIDSSSWAITRGFKRHSRQLEICYCHTPPRYLYGYDTSRNWKDKWFGIFVQFYAMIVNHFMRLYDFRQAQIVDFFIANSVNTAKRIKQFWKRDAVVIFPPVILGEAQANSKPIERQDYFLTGGRLVAAKNFDLIIKACAAANVNLKIFGSGVMETELRELAGANVEFLGKISDSECRKEYERARGFIAAQQDEDFGMTLVEAQGSGCPVIAYRGGGYLETVREAETGVFFDELSVDSLVSAIKLFGETKFNEGKIKKHVEQFSQAVFQTKIKTFVEDRLRELDAV